jgi:hypothetical protein
VAAQLKQELGVEAELMIGDAGEFTVWVGDAKVSEKQWGRFPGPTDVIAAVRAQLP